MRNRPWLVGVVAFVVVLGFGGFALAAPGIFSEPEATAPVLTGDDGIPAEDATESIIEEKTESIPEDKSEPVVAEAVEPTPDDKSEPVVAEAVEPTPEDKSEPVVADKPEPLFLTITEPAAGEHFTEKVIRFAGTTLPGATVVSASGYEADVDDAGNWSIILVLSPGGNKAKFIAENEAGSRAEASVLTYYDPPPGNPVDIVVNQKYGECSANPPYDKFYGTAPEGTKILITSEYGSADGYADAKGEFWIKVHFYEAPHGDPFPVTVTAAGQEFGFEFTSWAPSLDDLEFTATQRYGSSEATPPYDKFEGTAPPGTKIMVTSAYGSADGSAGDWGEYLVKVHFYDAPHGEAFPVTVTDGTTSFEFSFTSWAPSLDDLEFTATQMYGEVGNDRTWDKFYGQAPPGTAITVTSAYGSADGSADGEGGYWIKVYFSDAPYGEPFLVTVSDGIGTFEFTVTSYIGGES